MKGIEPSSVAWEATALPLSYTRNALKSMSGQNPHAIGAGTAPIAGAQSETTAECDEPGGVGSTLLSDGGHHANIGGQPEDLVPRA